MKTQCPRCNMIKNVNMTCHEPQDIGYIITKRLPITTFCVHCGTEFNIKLNSYNIKENYNESSLCVV